MWYLIVLIPDFAFFLTFTPVVSLQIDFLCYFLKIEAVLCLPEVHETNCIIAENTRKVNISRIQKYYYCKNMYILTTLSGYPKLII